jgi:hypothetical protein
MKIIQPVRQKHHCTQVWNGTRKEVFILLCPVKERDWTPDWDPKLVISSSGVMEQECLFIEDDSPSEVIWIVSKHDPVDYEVVMYRVVPGLIVGRFAITLESEAGNMTTATVSYEQPPLGEEGEKIVDEFTAESFTKFMDEFTLAINHYLKTGKLIEASELIKQEAEIHH